MLLQASQSVGAKGAEEKPRFAKDGMVITLKLLYPVPFASLRVLRVENIYFSVVVNRARTVPR